MGRETPGKIREFVGGRLPSGVRSMTQPSSAVSLMRRRIPSKVGLISQADGDTKAMAAACRRVSKARHKAHRQKYT